MNGCPPPQRGIDWARRCQIKLSLAAAAKKYNKNPKTLRRWIQKGLIPFEKNGRKHYELQSEDIDKHLGLVTKQPTKQYNNVIVVSSMTDEQLEADTLVDLLERVKQEETNLFEEIQVQRAVTGDMANPLGLKQLREQWGKLVAERLRLEKTLPEAMFNAGKFVDADKVRAAVNKIFSNITSVMDQMGMQIGDASALIAEEHLQDTIAKVKKNKKHKFRAISANEFKLVIDQKIGIIKTIIETTLKQEAGL